jgi:WD40 repeat protein
MCKSLNFYLPLLKMLPNGSEPSWRGLRAIGNKGFMRRHHKFMLWFTIVGGFGLLVWLRPELVAPFWQNSSIRQKLEPAATFQTNGLVVSLAFSPNGQTLAIATGNPNAKGNISLWRLPDRRLIQTLAAEDNNTVWGVAFSPDGQTLASGSTETEVSLWRMP